MSCRKTVLTSLLRTAAPSAATAPRPLWESVNSWARSKAATWRSGYAGWPQPLIVAGRSLLSARPCPFPGFSARFRAALPPALSTATAGMAIRLPCSGYCYSLPNSSWKTWYSCPVMRTCPVSPRWPCNGATIAFDSGPYTAPVSMHLSPLLTPRRMISRTMSASDSSTTAGTGTAGSTRNMCRPATDSVLSGAGRTVPGGDCRLVLIGSRRFQAKFGSGKYRFGPIVNPQRLEGSREVGFYRALSNIHLPGYDLVGLTLDGPH